MWDGRYVERLFGQKLTRRTRFFADDLYFLCFVVDVRLRSCATEDLRRQVSTRPLYPLVPPNFLPHHRLSTPSYPPYLSHSSSSSSFTSYTSPNRLGFLPDHLALPQDVYFRSTNMPRTIESLQQIVHGLYPMNKCEEVVPLIRIRCVIIFALRPLSMITPLACVEG